LLTFHFAGKIEVFRGVKGKNAEGGTLVFGVVEIKNRVAAVKWNNRFSWNLDISWKLHVIYFRVKGVDILLI